jgi:hypothetical protein
MTPAKALIEVESRFIVHEEVGLPIVSYGTDDSEHDTGARDWSKAPNGKPYVAVTSGGTKLETEPHAVMFSDEGRAWQWWYYAVLDYAETVAPESEWPTLHLYWRERPTFEVAEYISTSQAATLQLGHPMFNLRLGTVYSRLLISKIAPDGTEA